MTKREWYQQQAEVFGQYAGAVATMKPWPIVKSPRGLEHNRLMVEQHYQNARLAGHFAGLVLVMGGEDD